MAKAKQREVMRALFINQVRCAIAQYAEMERIGVVERDSNKHAMSAESYAAKLISDGLRKEKKKWLLLE